MALNGQDMQLRLSVASGFSDPQSDPNASLGGFMSSTPVEEVESSVTAVGDTFTFTDNTQTTVSHVGKWVLFVVSGTVHMQARRCVFHDTGTGLMGFTPGFTAAPAVSDVYRVFPALSLYDALTEAQAAAGHTDYRMIYLNNVTGSALTDVRAYLTPLVPGTVQMRVAVGNTQIIGGDVDTVADEETAPDLIPATGFCDDRQFWHAPRSYEGADGRTPFDNAGTFGFNNNRRCPLWLERVLPPLGRALTGGAWLLSVEADNDPATITGAVIAFDSAGLSPQLAVAFDRTPRTFGGARVTATVLGPQGQTPLPGEAVDLELVAPSPGALVGSLGQETDAAGQVGLVYDGPEDEAEVGEDVQVQATVGGF